MRLERVEIENYRAIEKLELPLDPSLTVLHGANGDGKTSVLSAIAAGLGSIPMLLPDVAGIGFRKTDQRGARPIHIRMTATDETTWDRRKSPASKQVRTHRVALRDRIQAIVDADRDGKDPEYLPIVVFYDTDRSVFDAPQRRRGFKTEFPRYAALDGALSPKTNFRDFFKWFYALENEELRKQKERRSFDFHLKELEAVRRAIEALVSGISEPRIKFRPMRFAVTMKSESGKVRELALDQLSGGYRIMLALAADLARRMAQGNPHLDDPLRSEAVVLIDEVDLHLHPRWQQRVLPDLTRTFPNAQFVVSTHSPQVLTTVEPERIVRLYRDDGDDRVRAGHEVGPTYGAEASGVLEAVMEVRERPAGNAFVETLKKYMALVDEGKGECAEARALRRDLEALSPEDYGLYRADAEMRRQRVMDRLGKPR